MLAKRTCASPSNKPDIIRSPISISSDSSDLTHPLIPGRGKIRRKMVEVMQQEASKVQLRELVKKLIPESIGKEIEKQAQGIFPLKDVLIRKVGEPNQEG